MDVVVLGAGDDPGGEGGPSEEGVCGEGGGMGQRAARAPVAPRQGGHVGHLLRVAHKLLHEDGGRKLRRVPDLVGALAGAFGEQSGVDA